MSKIFGSLVITLCCLALFAVVLGGAAVQAQALSGWSVPQRIPGLSDTGAYPFFVSDGKGAIHTFNSQWVRDQYNIVYSRWEVEIGWSPPVDVVASPIEQARVVGVLLNKTGEFNLVFWGGNELGADMYFTRARGDIAAQSTAWTKPLTIGRSAISPTCAALAGDGEDFIAVVYSGNILGNGLYYIYSLDAGNTWSDPNAIFLTAHDQLWPSALQLYLASDGQLHAVWSVGDETGNGMAIYHARSSNDRISWSAPLILAQAIQFEADTPSIIEYQDELFVIYHNYFPTTRWMSRSIDGGQTWSVPVRLFDQVGSNGAAALVIDGDDQLHMFFGNRVDDLGIHGLWHSRWLGKGWSRPEAVQAGPQIPAGTNGEEGFDPSFAQAIVTQGNLLFVAWRHDPRAGPTNIWYVYQYLDPHQYIEITVPTPERTIPSVSEPLVTTTSPDIQQTPADFEDLFGNTSILGSGIAPNLALLVSMALVIIVIVVISVVFRLRS